MEYELIVDTDESDRRLEILHVNVMNYGTIYNTVAEAIELEGKIRRKGLIEGGSTHPFCFVSNSSHRSMAASSSSSMALWRACCCLACSGSET